VEVTNSPDAPRKHKIVYHLSEPGADKAKFVLTNMKNHAEGVGWKNIAAMELVAHGPAVKTFVSEGMDPDLRGMIDKLVADGMTLTICGNTMTKMNLPKDQLVTGCSIATKGGVVRLMELQEQGYTYIRP
jgi:intracellular sulfur oxidation DsrE/DsrF family protein